MNAPATPPAPLPLWRERSAGLLLTAAVAGASMLAATLPWMQAHGLSALTLAIVLGMLVGNTVYSRIGAACGPGVGYAKHWLLRAGIVLYGARLTFQDIGHVGAAGLLIDLLVVCSTFALAWWAGTRWFGMEREEALLIGAGSSVCGAAAVMAAEPVVRGRAAQVAVAVATVVVFGTVSMFLYPLLYDLARDAGWSWMNERAYGLFAGSTIHEVAQVVGAGRAVGQQAADNAVIVKMVRVILLAPGLVLLSALLARGKTPRGEGAKEAVRIVVPWFAFGFIGVIALHSLPVWPQPFVGTVVGVDNVLLAMAMAALGLTTHASALRQAGLKPLLLAALLFGWLLTGGLAINLGVSALFV